jgi:Tol biopolymer transport system component
MKREQWQRVKEIFGEALDRAPSEREAFIHQAAGDPELLAELLRLLKETERESDLLSKPVLADAWAVTQKDAPRFAPSAVLARRFRIVRFIARGGMGEVYEAEDMELGERVALKAIRQRVGSDTDLRALFKREIQLARRVTHPNVCRLFDLEQHEDPESGEPILLLSMELIEGQTLTEYLRQGGPLNHRSALPLIEDVAAGLQAIHDAGIIHGDLKPSNVMLVTRPGEAAPRAVVMDFGMAFPAGEASARGTASESETVNCPSSPGDSGPTLTLYQAGGGFVGGTPDYFAPELKRGEPASMVSDVYAFALVIGDMLGAQKMNRVEPHSENMPRRWSRILRRCLAEDPARRCSRAVELAERLHTALDAPAKTRRIVTLAACAAMVVLLAANRIDVLLRGTVNGLILSENLGESIESASPDGQFLAGESWDTGDLTIRAVGSRKIRRLTHKTTSIDAEFGGAFGAIFSPDGRHIAYVWRNSRSDSELRIIGVDGKGERMLYHAADGTDPFLMDWSPDGSRILFGVSRLDFKPPQLAVLTLQNNSVRLLDHPPAGSHALFDADGRGFLFEVTNPQTGASEIHRLVPDGSESTLLARPGSNSAIAWSPDRGRLIFSSDRRGQPGIWAVAVSARGVEGEPRELVPNSKGWEPLGVSRSGALFYRQDSSTVDVYTAVLDVPSRKTVTPPRRVTERFAGFYSDPSWSEDGKQLVIHSRLGAPRATLAVYTQETGDLRELRPDVMGANRPQFVEHGAAIMVMGAAPHGPRGLYRVDARSGEATLFRSGTDLGTTFEGAWSRDGKFHYNRFGQFTKGLFRWNIATGERRILYVPPPEMNMGLENLALSPDGRTLAFHLHSDAAGASTLMLMPSEGGVAEPLFTVKTPYRFWYGSFTWTPDSQAILVASTKSVGRPQAERRVSEIWRVPADHSVPEKIDFPAAVEIECMRLNADGKTIAFHSPQWKSEIWVLQKFM